jgi:protein TonB
MPTADEFARLYPPLALAKETTPVRAQITCIVTAKGTLSNCTSSNEDPVGLGAGDAAIKAAKYFRMELTDSDGRPVAGRSFTTRMRWVIK